MKKSFVTSLHAIIVIHMTFCEIDHLTVLTHIKHENLKEFWKKKWLDK